MRYVHLGTPPTDDAEALETWLSELIIEINASLESAPTLQIERRVPKKPEAGRVYYFPDADPPVIAHAGYYGYHEDDWVRLG